MPFISTFVKYLYDGNGGEIGMSSARGYFGGV